MAVCRISKPQSYSRDSPDCRAPRRPGSPLSDGHDHLVKHRSASSAAGSFIDLKQRGPRRLAIDHRSVGRLASGPAPPKRNGTKANRSNEAAKRGRFSRPGKVKAGDMASRDINKCSNCFKPDVAMTMPVRFLTAKHLNATVPLVPGTRDVGFQHPPDRAGLSLRAATTSPPGR